MCARDKASRVMRRFTIGYPLRNCYLCDTGHVLFNCESESWIADEQSSEELSTMTLAIRYIKVFSVGQIATHTTSI